ncbi:PRC-barrel domain-containing protein [Palleronia sp. LCG004]|uniref:PRC-barrel domain-containing protein n=1 Tax=Palleronia sp. LCG004 TaxID=3079304 RepID=UPI002941E6D2|nr:PRC-barrel domain-containing protein [Palleronia sp. LCG004]WOI56903.1 PRC-barrel domain-containing protein [Palleronia sp. LCG004]
MKPVAIATALVLTASGSGVWAQVADVPPFGEGSAFGSFEADADAHRASDLIGAEIYMTEAEIPETVEFGPADDWSELGEITDIVIGEDGSVQAAIVGIGGFLGLGERDVAVDFDHVHAVPETNGSGDRLFVVQATRNEVESAPPYEPAEL